MNGSSVTSPQSNTTSLLVFCLCLMSQAFWRIYIFSLLVMSVCVPSCDGTQTHILLGFVVHLF